MNFKTKTAAAEIATKILIETAPRGTKPYCLDRLREDCGDSMSLNIERSWGVGCDIYVNFHYGTLTAASLTENRDGTWGLCAPRRKKNGGSVIKIPTYRVEVSVNWSATSRDVATAQACVALYQECVNIAAEIQSALGSENIYHEQDLRALVEEDESVDQRVEILETAAL